MINRKSIIIILGYVALVLGVVSIALILEIQDHNDEELVETENVSESRFSKMNYYFLKGGEPRMHLESDQLNIYGDVDVTFHQPRGELLNPEGKTEFRAIRGIYSKINETLSLRGEVFLKKEDSTYQSETLFYQELKNRLDAEGGVKTTMHDPKTKDILVMNSDKLVAHPKTRYALFTGNAHGEINRARKFEGKVNIRAQSVEANLAESLVKLDQDVFVNRNNLKINASRGEFFLENFNKSLKYFALYDDIKLVEETPKFKRRAFAESIDGVVSQNKVVLSGAPRVEQGHDVVRGYRITLRENAELIEVEDSQSQFDVGKDKKKSKENKKD